MRPIVFISVRKVIADLFNTYASACTFRRLSKHAESEDFTYVFKFSPQKHKIN